METDRRVGANSEQEQPHFDAIVVLGKNIGIGWHKEQIEAQKYHLSEHSRINVLAAGILYTRGLTRKIIFSTGKTSGAYIPSEAHLMKRRLQQIWPSIPDEDIILEEESKQTRENAEEVKPTLDQNPDLQRLALVTVGFHTRRANGLFNQSGIDFMKVINSADVVGQYFPEMMEKYNRGNLLEKIKETIGTPIQLYISPLAKNVEKYVRSSRS